MWLSTSFKGEFRAPNPELPLCTDRLRELQRRLACTALPFYPTILALPSAWCIEVLNPGDLATSIIAETGGQLPDLSRARTESKKMPPPHLILLLSTPSIPSFHGGDVTSPRGRAQPLSLRHFARLGALALIVYRELLWCSSPPYLLSLTSCTFSRPTDAFDVKMSSQE